MSDPWAAFPDAPDAKPQQGGDAWGAFPDAPTAAPATTEQPSSFKDFVYSAAAGVPRGAVEMGMLPVTAARVVKDGGLALYDKIAGTTPEEQAQRTAEDQNSYLGGFLQRMFDGQDAIRGKMDENLYEPRTTAGKYGRTIGEFATPGSLVGRAGAAATTGREVARSVAENAVGNVVLPAVASEGAGQLTEGTGYEGLSRFLGALFGNTAIAGYRTASAPEAFIRRAAPEMTDADWQRAIGLQNNTTGVRLSGPEAIAEARGGGTAMPDLLRVVEGSVEGRAGTAPFFTQRPAQVDTAVNNVLDQIAPQSAQPSTLGPRAAEAAGNVIDRTRQDINTQTRPLYDATGPVGPAGPTTPQVIPQAQFAPISADPRFQAGLARLRGNAELAPEYAGMPDNSIAVVDAVTKDLNARGEALANAANPLYGPELAGRSRAAAADARNAATTASPEYAQALATQEALRRTQLNPLEQGPVGRVAAAGDTTAAGSAILPQNPLTGSAGEAADATRRLAAEDPATTSELVRQNLADRYSKASTETQSGGRESAGIKFHKDVAGNDARSAVLDAVLRELPNRQASVSMPELLDVLHATGNRQAVGSRTAFNAAAQEALGSASPAAALFGLAKSLGSSFVTQAGDATRRAALRGNLGTLAQMFTDPNSVELIRDAIARGPGSTLPAALARTGAEMGGTIYDPAGQR